MVGIYKITNPKNKVYIGQSVDIEARLYRYKKIENCKVQTKIFNSLRKYGVENHTFEVAWFCNVSELNYFERKFQLKYNAIGQTGLNCKITGDDERSGYASKEFKSKIGFNALGNKYMLGKKHSDATKKKMSEKKIGRKLSEQTKNKIKFAQLLISDEIKLKRKNALLNSDYDFGAKKIIDISTGAIYKSISEVSKLFNIKYTTLNAQLLGQNKNKTNFRYLNNNN
jgi:group I intron endonuclease